MKVAELPLYAILGREGNTKVPSSTAIFNMTSALDCPSMKLGLCKAATAGVKCYARKAEQAYPNVLPYRNKQAKYWKTCTASDFISQFLTINHYKRNKFKALRFNESGDFSSQKCLDKAEKIARHLELHGIVTYCYSSRDDLDYGQLRALRVSGSGFKKDGVVNEFRILKKGEDIPDGFGRCRMNCRICKRCLQVGTKTVVYEH